MKLRIIHCLVIVTSCLFTTTNSIAENTKSDSEIVGLLGINDEDANKNMLWDSIEKTKELLLKDVGLIDQYSITMSDRLQLLMQQGLLNVDKPKEYMLIINQHVHEMACLDLNRDSDRVATIVSILEVSFAANNIKGEDFKMVNDAMAKFAYDKPDVDSLSCSQQKTIVAHKKPKYTGRVRHDFFMRDSN